MNRGQKVGATPGKAPPGSEKNREKRNGKDIGPIGTTARIAVGLGFVGSVIHGQLSVHLAPTAFALGLIGFPALVLVWLVEDSPHKRGKRYLHVTSCKGKVLESELGAADRVFSAPVIVVALVLPIPLSLLYFSSPHRHQFPS